ncbi:MAG: gluconokinase [Bacteroidota bacterium]
MKPVFVIVMGVSGSGKSTVGEGLSAETGWPFYDADDFHPPANVAKMAAGQPLNDEDRWPWLDRLHQLIAAHQAEGKSGILACSALKDTYRKRLAEGQEAYVRFAFLQGDFALIAQRMTKREDHYMPVSLLKSQFEALEAPADAITLDIAHPPEQLVQELKSALEFTN